jgi:hypothetical protein
MYRISSILAAAFLLALCSGCATKGSGMGYKPNSYRATLDTEMIAAVESQANLSGTRVTWVHPPRKAKKAPQ